jgi:hypothetical protein
VIVGPWVELPVKPARVADCYRYWVDPPPELSERCSYWVAQIERGFVPNRKWRSAGCATAASLFGVYVWEYVNVLCPLLSGARAVAE